MKKFINELKESIQQQSDIFDNTLILNPVENVPFKDILEPCSVFLHGLYNTDTVRDLESKYNSKIQFSGRGQITQDVNDIYNQWAKLLDGEKVSMRLLSGLHAHTVLFMGISKIGDKVLYLPEKAGGHTSGKAILERLGLQIMELPIDYDNFRIDIEKAKVIYDSFNPDILFIDRSEGLIYEDFTELCSYRDCYKIFDASQYLTNIIFKDYKNPFEMRFNLILSTMHKNLPGPQRAFVCSKEDDKMWKQLKSHISTYVSNMHVFTIYSAGLLLDHMDQLCTLSKRMLENATLLDKCLSDNEVIVIERKYFNNEMPTHHCWIKSNGQEEAFKLYLSLEQLGLMSNYRLLPYNIGYGLRIGMSGATMSGLKPEHIPELAYIIGTAYKDGYSEQLKKRTTDFIRYIKEKANE